VFADLRRIAASVHRTLQQVNAEFTDSPSYAEATAKTCANRAPGRPAPSRYLASRAQMVERTAQRSGRRPARPCRDGHRHVLLRQDGRQLEMEGAWRSSAAKANSK